MQLGFHVNVARCIGCHTCEVACQETNGLPVGVCWRRVRVVEGGAYPRPFAYAVSMACNHCADPICVKVCPAGAYGKRADGLVVHDPSRCIGCQYCAMACPYSAPQYDEAQGKMSKCSGCAGRVDAGLQPACVGACPVRALAFGDLSDLGDLAATCPSGSCLTETLPLLPSPRQTRPSIRFKVRPEVTLQAARVLDGHRVRKI
ncbi:MAG: 4Fe-4S ferredoxin [Symbiobacteriaceae bacterium]|jgi:anaerobic dimethyl sulfoxide reductase subunit B (iron-sulfur subunit)|nr:4Fe-4S ferredoxin [Symbiobacteriaceae bacterium]